MEFQVETAETSKETNLGTALVWRLKDLTKGFGAKAGERGKEQ
jgi:hypothetical protein